MVCLVVAPNSEYVFLFVLEAMGVAVEEEMSIDKKKLAQRFLTQYACGKHLFSTMRSTQRTSHTKKQQQERKQLQDHIAFAISNIVSYHHNMHRFWLQGALALRLADNAEIGILPRGATSA